VNASQTTTLILLPDGSRGLVLVKFSFLAKAQPLHLRQDSAARRLGLCPDLQTRSRLVQ
jgi:hypothetical protein